LGLALGVTAVADLIGLGSEEAVLKALADPAFKVASVESVEFEQFVRRGWHEAVLSLIAAGHRSSEADAQQVAKYVRLAVQTQRNRLDNLTRALDRNYGKTVDVVPASQWAQNTTHVFLTMKFAQRWNAPGALEVVNETVDISGCCFNFTAYGEHSFIKRRYQMSLEFFRSILPVASFRSAASVGRMSVTLAKATPANWPRLLAVAGSTPKNLGIWRDMKEKWKNELERMPPLLGTGKQAAVWVAALGEDDLEPQTVRKPDKRKQSIHVERRENDNDALDREVKLMSECSKASYSGSPVAELCSTCWKQVVDQPRVRGRQWLVELYSSQGTGDAQAMRGLMPVWKRLANIFPSMVPGGRVGAVDCRTEGDLCKRLAGSSKLPQIFRIRNSGKPEVWRGGTSASIEQLANFGSGGRQEL